MDFDTVLGLIAILGPLLIIIIMFSYTTIKDHLENINNAKLFYIKHKELFETKKHFIIRYQITADSSYQYKIVDFFVNQGNSIKVNNRVIKEFRQFQITSWNDIYRYFKSSTDRDDIFTNIIIYTPENEKQDEIKRLEEKEAQELLRSQLELEKVERNRKKQELINKKTKDNYYLITVSVEEIIKWLVTRREHKETFEKSKYKPQIRFLVYDDNHGLYEGCKIVIDNFYDDFFARADVLSCKVIRIAKKPSLNIITEDMIEMNVVYKKANEYHDEKRQENDYVNYRNHCWNCHSKIDSKLNRKCPKCKTFYICGRCGKCLCDKHTIRRY